MKRRDRSSLRSVEAEERRAARLSRTDKEQLDRLERAGHGDCKEAVRLRESIANGLEAKAEVTVSKVKRQAKNTKGKKARKEASKK